MPLDKKRGKGGKYKRGNQKVISLSGDDLQYLIEHTNYDAREIMEWFRSVITIFLDMLLTVSYKWVH